MRQILRKPLFGPGQPRVLARTVQKNGAMARHPAARRSAEVAIFKQIETIRGEKFCGRKTTAFNHAGKKIPCLGCEFLRRSKQRRCVQNHRPPRHDPKRVDKLAEKSQVIGDPLALGFSIAKTRLLQIVRLHGNQMHSPKKFLPAQNLLATR